MRRPTSRQTALLAAVLLLPLFAVTQYRASRSTSYLLAPFQEYLAAHRQPLDLSEAGAHFDASLIDTHGKRIFLLGESHGIAINEDLDFDLLRYLHRTAHVRIYFPEIPYSQSCLLNRYLETGDEDLLDFLFREIRGTSMWTREHREFIHRVRAWNASMDRRDRIRIVGVDVEHQPRVAMRFLADSVMDARGKVPDSIEATLSQINALRSSSDLGQFAEELVSSIRQHRSDYSALLSDRFFDFEMAANNLERTNPIYGKGDPSQAVALREQIMYDTFRRIYPRLTGASCYGRWGADHIVQRAFQGHESFAAMLDRQDSPVAGQIVSIQPIYQHSYGTISNGRTYQDYDASAPASFLAPFGPLAQGSVTMFRTLPGYPPGEGAQYVVFIRDAAAAHPLEESPKIVTP